MTSSVEFERWADAVSLNVSRETIDRLRIYETMLRRWQGSINLVASSTLDDIWIRHFADSLQLLKLRTGGVWVDLGSGAGLPGLALAMVDDMGPTAMHLVERDTKKCAFLRAVARETGIAVEVHCRDFADILPGLNPCVITARALAPLDRLLQWTLPQIENGAEGLFLKGRTARDELTALRGYETVNAVLHPSLTDKQASIVRVARK